jgi:hypothetical protein
VTLFFVMRILHVCLGVFWAGTIVFVAVYLSPSMRDAGPGSGKILVALQRRGYFTAMPVVALLTVISGFWMYWNIMTTIGPAWAGSMSARVYGVGAAAGLVALLFGVFWVRPASINMVRLVDRLGAAAPGTEKDALEAELSRERMRSGSAIRWVAALLVVTVLCMAVGRYV